MAYIHSVLGRVRLKDRAFCDKKGMDQLCAALRVEPGVETVHFNSRAHSLIVQFDPSVQSTQSILEAVGALQSNLYVIDTTTVEARPLRQSKSSAVTSLVMDVALGALFRRPIERSVASLLVGAMR